MNSEVDNKCYLCDLFLEYEEFGDIKNSIGSNLKIPNLEPSEPPKIEP